MKELITKNAKCIFDFIKWLFTDEQSQNQIVYFPIYIGYNGYKFDFYMVNKEFENITTHFSTCYCNDVRISNDRMLIAYKFSIQRMSSSLDDEVLEKLVQKEAEKVLAYFMAQYECYIAADALTHVEIRGEMLWIVYAINSQGVEKIAERKKKVYHLRMQGKKREEQGVFTENWEQNKQHLNNNLMTFGFDKKYYDQYGLAIPIRLDVKSYPHVLVTGASGSGKSQALLYLLGKLLQAYPDVVVYFCDFKNSEDFSFLVGYPYYYAGHKCYQGLMEYYERFTDARENGNDGKRYILIFDEYPAFVNHLQMMDKADKTKQANDVLCAIAEILMLGRGLNFGVWLTTQRADSTMFANGSRDNFMVVIGLGRMSKEQKSMVFAGQDIPDIVYQAGEGLLLADGHELVQVKYPLIEDIDNWKKEIRRILEFSSQSEKDVGVN